MKSGKIVLVMAVALAVAGCQGGVKSENLFGKPAKSAASGDAAQAQTERSVKMVDRDVEAPDIFDVTTTALWDGRPSLGGVWVAYPGVKEPERVIIRNPANGKFVIGALFRREIGNAGPKLQLSSDAATALGLAAGQPAKISVTALKRVQAGAPEAAAKTPAPAAADKAEQAGKTAAKPVSQVTAEASAAIDKAAKTAKPTPPAARPQKSEETAAAPAARRYVQIGIFSVEANAKRADRMVTKTGARVEVNAETIGGKTFWRVLAGPADTAPQQRTLLAKVKGVGFGDAFLVKK